MLDISNVVRIATLSAAPGLANANTSALALFTHSKPLFPNIFGEYRVYLDAAGVAKDFGASSSAAKMANAVFSQTPNITSGGGYLAVIPLLGDAPAAPAVIQTRGWNISSLPAKLALTISVNDEQSIILMENLDMSSVSAFQNSLSSYLNGVGVLVSVGGALNSAEITFSTTAVGNSASIAVLPTSENDVNGYTDLSLLWSWFDSAIGADSGEEQLPEALLRTLGKVFYFGAMFDEMSDLPYSTSRLKQVAQMIQGMDKILFVCTNIRARVTDNFQSVSDSSLSHTRCLFHGGSIDECLAFQAGYASRAMSVNYAQENSAMTMNGKVIASVPADKTVDQTWFNALKAAGVDFYGDFGVPRVMSAGANEFYDNVANILAMKLRLQIETFNALTGIPTKVPQTELGMDFLKSNLRQVLDMFARSGVIAPGAWTSATTYGNAERHIASIRQLGYWVHSTPLSQQSQTDRAQRIAPPIYIAVKFAGAIHTVDLVFYVEV